MEQAVQLPKEEMNYIDRLIQPAMKTYEDMEARNRESLEELHGYVQSAINQRMAAFNRGDMKNYGFWDDEVKKLGSMYRDQITKDMNLQASHQEFYRSDKAFYTPKGVYRKSKSKRFKRNY